MLWIFPVLILRRLVAALRFAQRDQGLVGILVAGALLIAIGTFTYTVGDGWSVVDGFYVAVATLTTSSVLDSKLAITDGWLKVFTAVYVLVGIGILVEVARRLGMGFIAARAEMLDTVARARTRRRGGSG